MPSPTDAAYDKLEKWRAEDPNGRAFTIHTLNAGVQVVLSSTQGPAVGSGSDLVGAVDSALKDYDTRHPAPKKK